MSEYIYVLRLRDGKYYVGRSANVDARFRAHLEGTASAWTKLHAPIEIVQRVASASRYDEDAKTLELMDLHGVDAVRGGQYANVVLTPQQRAAIASSHRAAKDECLRCGAAGHFVAQCKAAPRAAVAAATRAPPEPARAAAPARYTPTCYYCGREGHLVPDCPRRHRQTVRRRQHLPLRASVKRTQHATRPRRADTSAKLRR